MLPLIPIAIGSAVVAGLAAVCSSWEDENEEAEEELEERRARYARTIRRRKARLLRNRRMKAATVRIAVLRKQLDFAKRAEEIARRYADVGRGRLDSFKGDLHVLVSQAITIPAQAQAFERQYLANVGDMTATCRKCQRQVTAVRRQLEEAEDVRFYFTCARCHRRFAVRAGELEEFNASKIHDKAYCGNCR